MTTDTNTPKPIALADIVWDPQPYCDMTLKRPFWKHTELGIGRVCNTPIPEGTTSCPNTPRHA